MSKILLVEDDNNLREIYEARLQAEGYVIASAKDGEEALVIAKSERPDLIISDVMMPKISGFEMLDILRNTPELRDTKVIMLTALGQAEDQSRASHLGADRYLVKSQVTLEDIVKEAHELLEDMPQPESTNNEATSLNANPAPEVATPVSQPVQQPVDPLPQTPVDQPVPFEKPTVETQNLVNAAMPAVEPAGNLTTEIPTVQTPTSTSDEIIINSNGQLSSADLNINPSVSQPLSQVPTEPTPLTNMPPEATVSETVMNTAQIANDQTLNQAVNNLINDTNQAPLQPSDPTNTFNDESMTTQNSTTVEETNAPSNQINGRKVIHPLVQPLDQPPQKSLDELLALNDASQQIMPTPSAEPAVNDQNKAFDPTDPNNIAL
jgi:CheY-like chemotaxis protein